VSLLLSTRKTERDKAEQEQLERRNRWRALQGLPPLDRTDDDKTPDNQNADTEQPDPLLNESTQILADLVTFSQDIDQTLVMSQ
jgi:hypothetical protein